MADTINLSRFIPKFMLGLFSKWGLYNNAYLLGQRGAIWISVAQPYKLYNEIPELKAVIDRGGSMFSGMQITKRNVATNEVIEDVNLKKLITNPNFMQSQNAFLKQYWGQLNVYGNQFIYKNKTKSATYPQSLWCISPYYLQPVLTGKLFQQTEMSGVIEKYKMINAMSIESGGTTSTYNVGGFSPDEILFTRIADLNNPIIGRSPIASLQFPLSNIETAYKASNVAMQHVGVGIVSPSQNKDAAGSLPLQPKAREDMETQFARDYGIGENQRRTILANSSVQFESMGVDVSKLLLKQEIDANLAAICNVYNINAQIFLTNTTYENLRSAMVQTYQDNIIPSAEEFMQALSQFLQLKPTEKLHASFDHIQILKENKLKGMQAIDSIVTSLANCVKNGFITPLQATNILANELGVTAEIDKTGLSYVAINGLAPKVADSVLAQLTINEQRALASYPPVAGGDVVPPPVSKPDVTIN